MTTLTTTTHLSNSHVWLVTLLYAAVVVGGVLFPFAAIAAYVILG